MNIKPETIPRSGDCFDRADELLPFDEAVAVAIATAVPLDGQEAIHLAQANGRILAGPVPAPASLPRYDHSAMDGYAVRCADFMGLGPWIVEVAGTASAGGRLHLDACVAPNTAMEIFTGAALPPGADAVVIRERCRRFDSSILIEEAPFRGENVRREGEDIALGELAVSGGTPISPHVAALLAALGMPTVSVRPRVRVAILSTGSELRRPGEFLLPNQIYDSNRYMAGAILDRPWITFTDLGMINDDVAAIHRAIEEGASNHDVLIVSGAMSKGGADFVRTAIHRAGGQLSVLNVAMRPGKPAAIGRVGNALFIGLPGNPMAAAVVLEHIGLPAIRATAGMKACDPVRQTVIADFDLSKRRNRTEFIPVSITGSEHAIPTVRALGRGSSGSLSPMANADGLVILPADLAEITRGQVLQYLPFGS